jgi:hypothetical protein
MYNAQVTLATTQSTFPHLTASTLPNFSSLLHSSLPPKSPKLVEHHSHLSYPPPSADLDYLAVPSVAIEYHFHRPKPSTSTTDGAQPNQDQYELYLHRMVNRYTSLFKPIVPVVAPNLTSPQTVPSNQPLLLSSRDLYFSNAISMSISAMRPYYEPLSHVKQQVLQEALNLVEPQ